MDTRASLEKRKAKIKEKRKSKYEHYLNNKKSADSATMPPRHEVE